MPDVSLLSRRLLRELCTNSRVSVTSLSEKLAISRPIISKRIKALEKEFGLKYTLELNMTSLGVSNIHVLRVKFDKKPKEADLGALFESSKRIQLALTTVGDFDLLLFVVAKSVEDYLGWELKFDLALSKYGVSTSPSEVAILHLGFVPVSDTLILASGLDETYKKILLELNSNSRIKISDLARRIDTSEDAVHYYMEKIEKEGIVKRFTAVATKPLINENIVYFADYTIHEDIERRVEAERKRMYWKLQNEFPILSEFQMMFSTSGSDMSFTWATYPNFKEGLKQSVGLHAEIYKRDAAVMRYARICNLVKGTLPLRNIDLKEAYDARLFTTEEL